MIIYQSWKFHENRPNRFREILCTKSVRKKKIKIEKKKQYNNNKVFRWKRKTLINMWYIKIHYKKLLNQDENLRAYWDIKYSGLRYLIYLYTSMQNWKCRKIFTKIKFQIMNKQTYIYLEVVMIHKIHPYNYFQWPYKGLNPICMFLFTKCNGYRNTWHNFDIIW